MHTPDDKHPNPVPQEFRATTEAGHRGRPDDMPDHARVKQ